MARDRCNFIEGGTYFFKLTLRDHGCELISAGTGIGQYPDVEIEETKRANERPVYAL